MLKQVKMEKNDLNVESRAFVDLSNVNYKLFFIILFKKFLKFFKNKKVPKRKL